MLSLPIAIVNATNSFFVSHKTIMFPMIACHLMPKSYSFIYVRDIWIVMTDQKPFCAQGL